MKTIKEYLNEGLIRRQAGMDMRAKIEAWLKEYGVKNYTINDDLTIDVNGNVDLYGYREKQLPGYIQFGIIKGCFNLRRSNVISLKGCPQEVGTDFECIDCTNLTSLEGGPQKVRDFCCGNTNLTSLEGAPQEARRHFSCGYCNELTSLQGAPKEIGGAFWCSDCPKLTSLQGVSEKIGSDFVCNRCTNLTSLEGAPKGVGGGFYCQSCGKKFNANDVEKVCKVNKKWIYT